MRKCRRLLVSFGLLTWLLAVSAQADLIHRYTFNDGTANDSVGSYDGTLVGNATISQGALQLNGDGYLQFQAGVLQSATGNVGATTNGTGTGQLTFETWFTAAPTTMSGNWKTRLFYFGDYRVGNYNVKYDQYGVGVFSDNSADQAGLSISYYTYSEIATTATLNTGSLVHVVAVLDNSTNSMRLYVNGKLDPNEPSHTLNYPNQPGVNAIHDIYNYLGYGISSYVSYLQGSIDEFRIYDHALTAEDVSSNYNAGPIAVPEPHIAALLLVALLSLAGYVWRRCRLSGCA